MAVLVEATSVIVRRDAIDNWFEGGWPHFQDIVPNRTLCTDGELARVGFMVPSDAQVFVERLQYDGLTFFDGEKAVDLVVVDQDAGPTTPVDWLVMDRCTIDDERTEVTACYLLDGSPATPSRTGWLTAPEGWVYEGSISQRRGLHRVDEHDEIVLVDHRDGIDVWRDVATGREVYTGRTQPVSAGVAASKDWIKPHVEYWSPCATCAQLEAGSDTCRAYPQGVPASLRDLSLREKPADPRMRCNAYRPRGAT
jgi:hypothetical protein